MNILVKSSNGLSQVPLETKLLSHRKIFLEGEIDDAMAGEFWKKVMLLNYENENAPIDCLINSSGGEISSGMMIYDAIQKSRAPIRTCCIGKAHSMAAILLACGNHGRYILPHGEAMLHEPLLGSRIGGNSSTIRSVSESLIEMKHKMNCILAKHTGRTEEEIEQAIGYDHYYTAEESVAFHLCDQIVTFDALL